MINDEVLNRNIVKKLLPAQNTLWFPVAEKQFIVTLNLKINSNYYRLKYEYIFFDLFELILILISKLFYGLQNISKYINLCIIKNNIILMT